MGNDKVPTGQARMRSNLASGSAAELSNDDAKIQFLAGGGYDDSIADKPEN